MPQISIPQLSNYFNPKASKLSKHPQKDAVKGRVSALVSQQVACSIAYTP